MLGKLSPRPSWFLAAGLILGAAVWGQAQTASPVETKAKVSEFGKYSGYSEPIYDGWVRSSRYVTVRDGTRIAVDILRPTRGGKVAEEKLPVVWTHHRYQRAGVYEGKLYTAADLYEWMPEVLRHGYVVAAADTRGGGASFGTFEGFMHPDETNDAYDITEWLAAQPWSNGKIGMYGGSYLGMTQYMLASRKPPHLKAIFPDVALVDMYALLWHGGIFRRPFIENWSRIVRELDVDKPAPPVDEDKDGALLKAAIEIHKKNRDMAKLVEVLPYRDSVDAVSGQRPFIDWSPISFLKEIRESKVAVYHMAGWFDRYVRDQTVLFRNLDNPQKLTVGPWTHTQSQGLDHGAEHLRWWDYWLKGIDNGVMRDAPVHYHVMGAPEGRQWRSAQTWPLPQERRTPLYFAAGPSGTSKSVNDGLLRPEAPKEQGGQDGYTVDYSAAVSPNPRWTLVPEVPELSANDAKGLTYTTPPLPAAMEVTGHPVIHLWVSSSAPDADLFVYLEEVDATGASRYVSEGSLRASNRAVSDPGYNYLGLPYHSGKQADRKPLTPGEPVELAFDLFPTSNIFDAGNRLRITITGADKANAETPEVSPAPRLTVYRGAGRASYIEVPVIP